MNRIAVFKFFRTDAPLILLGAILALLLRDIGTLPQSLYRHPRAYIPPLMLAFGAYGVALAWLLRGRKSRATLPLILGFGTVFRLICLFQPQSLSTDIWRYVWDGHISVNGLNPYRYAPLDDHVAAYRTGYWHIINHKSWVTMYPPLSQRIFAGMTALGCRTPLDFKVVFFLFDVGCMVCILFLLRRLKLPAEQVAVYAWHPLVMMEISSNGHQDILGIFFMLLALLWIGTGETKRQSVWGGIGAGLSLMAKGYLLPAVPIFARKRPFWFGVAFTVTVAILFLPYMGHGSQIREGMDKYLHNQLRNAGVFKWIYQTIYFLWPHGVHQALDKTRYITTVILGTVVALLAWRPWKDEVDLARRSISAMGTFHLLSWTVYPWYGTWFVPLFCLMRDKKDRWAMFGWWLWTVLISLAYLNPKPTEFPWIIFPEYLPVIALLLWQGGFLPRKDALTAEAQRPAENPAQRNPLNHKDAKNTKKP